MADTPERWIILTLSTEEGDLLREELEVLAHAVNYTKAERKIITALQRRLHEAVRGRYR